MKPSIAVLTGPTAVGKSDFAYSLCERHPEIEIIHADSIALYRHADIGSAKPSAELQKKFPHHLIDVKNPDQVYTAGDFVRDVRKILDDVSSRSKRALIVGGTGFYLKALLYGLWENEFSMKADPKLREEFSRLPSSELYRRLTEVDPSAALRIGANDKYRLIRALEIWEISKKTVSELDHALATEPDPQFALLVVDREQNDLLARIKSRTQNMLKTGLITETQSLLQSFPTSRVLQAVGYAQVCDYLKKKLPPGRKIKPGIEGLQEEIELGTRQLVKRQRTWFRGQETAQWFVLDAEKKKLENTLEEIYS